MLDQIPPAEAHRLTPLFAERVTLTAVTDAVLEGRLGAAYVDDPEHPRLARLELGCYTVFGGDPQLLNASRLPPLDAPREFVLPEDGTWDGAMRALLGPKAIDRPMKGYVLDDPDSGALRAMAESVLDPFLAATMAASHAAQLDTELEPHALQVFEDPGRFSEHGMGYCALQGDDVVAAATTYALASTSAEVAIATHASVRQRGLATAVSAGLIERLLACGITPHWNASNPISQRLAGRLGFREIGICPILFLDGPAAPTTSPSRA